MIFINCRFCCINRCQKATFMLYYTCKIKKEVIITWATLDNQEVSEVNKLSMMV